MGRKCTRGRRCKHSRVCGGWGGSPSARPATFCLTSKLPSSKVLAVKRIVCMGGGPAGLYSAILLKQALPRTRIEVYERKRPDDTFGLGGAVLDHTQAGLSEV